MNIFMGSVGLALVAGLGCGEPIGADDGALAQVRAADVVRLEGVMLAGEGCRAGETGLPSRPDDLRFTFDAFSLDAGNERRASARCDLVIKLSPDPEVRAVVTGFRGRGSVALAQGVDVYLTLTVGFLEGANPPTWSRVISVRGGAARVFAFDGLVPERSEIGGLCGKPVQLRISLAALPAEGKAATPGAGTFDLTELTPVVTYVPC